MTQKEISKLIFDYNEALAGLEYAEELQDDEAYGHYDNQMSEILQKLDADPFGYRTMASGKLTAEDPEKRGEFEKRLEKLCKTYVVGDRLGFNQATVEFIALFNRWGYTLGQIGTMTDVVIDRLIKRR